MGPRSVLAAFLDMKWCCCCLYMLLLLTMPVMSAANQQCNSQFTVKAQCSNTQVLQPAGVTVGTCVSALNYSVPKDLVSEPKDDAGVVVLGRSGGQGYYYDPTEKQMEMCEIGYYCPKNEATGLYDQKIQCKSGEFCWPGSIKPTECGATINCPNGCRRVGGTIGIILFVVIAIVLLTLCVFTKMRETAMLRESNDAVDEYMDDSMDQFGEKFKYDIKPVGIEFENMGMKIKGAKEGTPPILQGVSGHFPPGSLVALMGPSGCGKTTFMNSIIDRAPYGIIEGTVKINGVVNGLALASNVVGFVPQDDIVHGDLTVYQNLYYHGKLRLPATTTQKDILQHVENCVKVLGLAKIRHKVVGTPEKRGVSGGQKKRVNIGLELVAMPSIMFMDEPTSGLDGAATVNIARCLSQLKSTGLTIICVIHQPRWLVFKEFTHLLLLGEGGQQIYSGRTEFMVSYLTDLGFRNDGGENPADWMIDVCSNLEKRYDKDGEVDKEFECPRDLYRHWRENHAADAVSPKSRWHHGDHNIPDLQPLVPRKTANLCLATYHVCGRIFRKTSLQKEISGITTFFMLGLVDSIVELIGFQDKCGGFNWYMLNFQYESTLTLCIFINMQHRFDFGEDKLMISREVNSGVQAFSIFLGRTLKSIIFGTLKLLAYSMVVFIFRAPMMGFVEFALGFIMLGLWWVSFSQMVSLACKDQMTAVLILLMIPIIEPMFSGGVCRQVMAIEDFANMFCPKGGTFGLQQLYFPGLWFWKMMWTAELSQFPDYVANFPPVNMTTYWFDVASKEEKTDGTSPGGVPYTATIWAGTGDDWGSSFGQLCFQNTLNRFIIFLLVFFMSSSNSKWMSDKLSRCTYCCEASCGMCRLKGYSVPQEELTLRRAKTAKVGNPIKVAAGDGKDEEAPSAWT